MNEALRAVTLGDEARAQIRGAGGVGEWVLVTLSIGSRSTAAMAAVIDEGGHLLAQFDARDWERIQAFTLRSQSPPSSRAPRYEPRIRDVHMPSAFPTTAEGLGAPFLQVLHYRSDEIDEEEGSGLDATLSSHGMVVEAARTLERCEDRLRTSRFHVLVLTMTKGAPELALLSTLPAEGRPVIVCLGTGAESIDLVRAFQAGADECLSREVSPSELAARLAALVLKKRAQKDDPHGNPGAA